MTGENIGCQGSLLSWDISYLSIIIAAPLLWGLSSSDKPEQETKGVGSYLILPNIPLSRIWKITIKGNSQLILRAWEERPFLWYLPELIRASLGMRWKALSSPCHVLKSPGNLYFHSGESTWGWMGRIKSITVMHLVGQMPTFLFLISVWFLSRKILHQVCLIYLYKRKDDQDFQL